MKRVLVTRAAENADALSELLRAAGFEPVEVPLIVREAVPGALDAVGGPFDWLLLTSAAAVDAITGPHLAVRAAAVGPATARRAAARGLSVVAVPPQATGAALADALGEVAGRRILYPRAEEPTPGTADRLRERGAEVVEVVAYRNVTPPGLSEALAAVLPVWAVTLLSGSAARRLAEALPGIEARIVAIGPSTGEVALASGLRVDAVADPHTGEGVVAALVRLREREP